MPARILIAGPHGAGKSVLVRRVMSLYRCRRSLPGGVGGLPRGYVCGVDEEHEDLCVLGNYEKTFRDRHGMSQFDRYKADFVAALKYANGLSCAVLCEGGFLSTKRVSSDVGKEFSSSCTVVWLSPPEARTDVVTRNGRCVDDVGFERHVYASMSVVQKMLEHGANLVMETNREDALRRVCSMIDAGLNPTLAESFVPDYR